MSPQKAATLTVAQVLRNLKPRRAEAPLQDDIAIVLRHNFTEIKREHDLTTDRKNRIDFFLELEDPTQRIGIEVKTGGSSQGIAAQLLRYALTGQIDGLVLLTTGPVRGLPHAFIDRGRTIPLVVVCIAHNALT